jgi:hypothetical protein
MPSAYIETSVPSYYVARPSENLIQASKQASTRKWWDGGCSRPPYRLACELEFQTYRESFPA